MNKHKSKELCDKLLSHGLNSFSDIELMMMVMHDEAAAYAINGKAGNDLRAIGKYSISELKRSGATINQAAKLACAIELGRRKQMSEVRSLKTIVTSNDLAQYLISWISDKTVEVFAVVYLNRANKIINKEIISIGGITGTVADPRIILKSALDHNAVSVILCHNHPSGSLKPSRADEDLTLKIKEAAKWFDIKVLDHVIVSETGYFSFADEGLL